MAARLDKKVLHNGMVILGEPMTQVQSVAFNFMLPAGASLMPDGACGAGAIITDWIFRGAGSMDSRQLCDAMDALGLHRNVSVTSGNINLGAALEASNLASAIDIYADVILQPSLHVDQFELSKQLSISDVVGLDDDPRHKVMTALTEKFYPDPLGRPTIGTLDDLQALTHEATSEIIRDKFNLSGCIFSIAGKYDFKAVCKQLEDHFDSELLTTPSAVKTGAVGDNYTHIQHDSAQVHIGLMTRTIGPGHPDYYNANVAVSILSGGMSSRLFTEVREKRGLCYAVGAKYSAVKQMAGINCYAGTTPDKAQETLDVIVEQFNSLGKGISQDEVQRAKVGLKSSLIMSSESSSSRASGIAGDYYLLGRVRSIDEMKEELDKVDVASVTKFLKDNPFENYTVVTIGPTPVKV